MEKELKYFFPKKDFWHSISKQLPSTNFNHKHISNRV